MTNGVRGGRRRTSGWANIANRYEPHADPDGLAAFEVEESRYSLRVDHSVSREEVEALLRVERSA